MTEKRLAYRYYVLMFGCLYAGLPAGPLSFRAWTRYAHLQPGWRRAWRLYLTTPRLGLAAAWTRTAGVQS